MATRSQPRRVVVAGVAVGLALLATGCGSSSKTSTPTTIAASTGGTTGSTTATTAGSTSGPATGSPVKIMVTGTLNSPAVAYPQAVNGAEAAAIAVNKAGGINGHPIVVESCNDSFNPNTAVSCANKAIADHVIAFVGGLEVFSAQLWPLLDKAGIPWVAPAVIAPDQMQNANSFPPDGGAITQAIGAGREAVTLGGKRVVNITGNNAAGQFVATFNTVGVKLAGGTVVKTVISDVGAVDDSAAVAQTLSAHPQGIVCACNSGDTPLLIKTFRQAGYTGPFVTYVAALTAKSLVSLGSLAGSVYLTSTDFAPSAPESAQFIQEMKTQPTSTILDNVAQLSWLGVHQLPLYLKGQTTVTAASLLAVLKTTHGVSGFGISPNGVNWLTKGSIPPVGTYPRVSNYDITIGKWDNSTKTLASSGSFTNALTGATTAG